MRCNRFLKPAKNFFCFFSHTKKLSPLLLLCILYAQSFCKPANKNQPFNLSDTIINPVTINAEWQQKTLNKPSCKGRRILINKGGDNGIYIDGNVFAYKPGDTLVLQSANNPYSYFAIGSLYGTKDCPVTIINEGGQVILSNGMAFDNCRYINITGAGNTNQEYGFKIEDPASNGVAIDIHGRSSYIEVQHVFIHNKTYGFWVKQEANCADSLQFPNWIISNIYLHDNKIIKMNQEGMYLGSTDPYGQRETSCNGVVIKPKPLRLGNIKVYNNIIDSVNRSGIQLSCASFMLNEIFNNTVTNCGFEFNTDQGNGISLGGYTHASVYNNNINNTYALGILCLGSGKIFIHDNTINNSGDAGGHKANGMAGIMVDTRPTDPVENTNFFLINNKIGANTDHAIRIYKTFNSYSKKNVVCNNSGTVIADKDVDWIDKCY